MQALVRGSTRDEERKRPRVSPLDEALTNLLGLICCPLCHTPASNDFFANGDRLECAALRCACGAAFCGICGQDCTDGGGGRKANDAHYHTATPSARTT